MSLTEWGERKKLSPEWKKDFRNKEHTEKFNRYLFLLIRKIYVFKCSRPTTCLRKEKNLFFACCPLHWQSHQWRHDVKRQRCQNKGSRRAHFSRQRHIEIMFLLKVRCYDLLCTEFFYAFSGRKLLNDLLQNFFMLYDRTPAGRKKKIPPL